VAERITQIGGEPNFNPDGLATRSNSEYVPGDSLVDMIREDLVAERIAIESYSEIIRWLGDDDPTTRLLIEQILKTEEKQPICRSYSQSHCDITSAVERPPPPSGAAFGQEETSNSRRVLSILDSTSTPLAGRAVF
jgi:Ferritin-like domain